MPTIDALIAQAEQDLRDTQTRLQALRDAQKAAPIGQADSSGYSSLGAQDAILAYLRANGPSKRKDVLNALDGNYKTTSAKPRQMLHTAIGAMVSKGTIKESRGKLSVP